MAVAITMTKLKLAACAALLALHPLAAAAPMTPQLQPDAVEVLIPFEDPRYVDRDDSIYARDGCQLADGTRFATGLPGLAVAPDLDGVGAYGLQLQSNTTGGGNGLVISHVQCGAVTQQFTLTSATAASFGFFRDFSVDESGRVCVPTQDGLWCGDLPAGALAIEVPIAAFMQLLPPVGSLVAAHRDQLPAGATYAFLELTSVVRSARAARSFIGGQVRFQNAQGSLLELRAGVVFERVGTTLRLWSGPGS